MKTSRVLRPSLLLSAFFILTLSGPTFGLSPLRCENALDELTVPVPLDPSRGEIFYRLYGQQNKRAIMLLHGMGGDSTAFPEIIPYLAQRFLVIVPDLRGHGESLAKGEDYSTKVMASDMKALVDHLKENGILKAEKLTVLGHSMGGRVAAGFAVNYPKLVDALVIEDMDMIRRTSGSAKKQRRALLKSREVARRLEGDGYRSLHDLAVAMQPFFNEPDFMGVMESATQLPNGKWSIRKPFPPNIFILYWNQANTDDFLPDLSRLKIPTLMIRADAPQYWTAMTDEGVRKTRLQFPEARIVQIPDSEHGVHSTQPESYLRNLFRFLNEVEPLR